MARIMLAWTPMNAMASSSAAAAPKGLQQNAVVPIATAALPIKPAAKKHLFGKWRKLVIALLVLAAALALVVIAFYSFGHPDRPVFRTVQVVRADITERVTATGTLQPVITSPVGAQVSGIVWKLHADYNSAVKAGDLLVCPNQGGRHRRQHVRG